MINFLEFIKGDIESKKTYISSLPTNNKSNIKKYNEILSSYIIKYNEYKSSVKKYLEVKSSTYRLEEKTFNLDEINSKLKELNYVCSIMNPYNTYFEKMDFDKMMYKMDNFGEFNFEEINNVINNLVDKFLVAGVALMKDDFNYTYYVKKYMAVFLDNRQNKNNSMDNLNNIFEEIYWLNPEIINHISICFRKLIRKYEKNFNNYLNSIKKDLMIKFNISNYDDAINKYHEKYKELNIAKEESVFGIIEQAKDGIIDIKNYFPDSKNRISLFESLSIHSLDYENKNEMDKFYDNLYKLKLNIIEYSNYLYFLPLFKNFKNTYQKKLVDDKKELNKNLESILSEIKNNENKLDKLNKKIFYSKNNLNIKKDIQDSLILANEIYSLHKKYDLEYFDVKVLYYINKYSSIKDLLNIYYSFDYFKMISLKKCFSIENYNELLNNLQKLDTFALNPENVICNVINIFEDENIKNMIVNKYRLVNINIIDDNLSSGDINSIISNIENVLRINEIEKSNLSVEKIWFITEVEKIINKK